jgi:hypothetical protein
MISAPIKRIREPLRPLVKLREGTSPRFALMDTGAHHATPENVKKSRSAMALVQRRQNTDFFAACRHLLFHISSGHTARRPDLGLSKSTIYRLQVKRRLRRQYGSNSQRRLNHRPQLLPHLWNRKSGVIVNSGDVVGRTLVPARPKATPNEDCGRPVETRLLAIVARGSPISSVGASRRQLYKSGNDTRNRPAAALAEGTPVPLNLQNS